MYKYQYRFYSTSILKKIDTICRTRKQACISFLLDIFCRTDRLFISLPSPFLQFLLLKKKPSWRLLWVMPLHKLEGPKERLWRLEYASKKLGRRSTYEGDMCHGTR